MQNMEQAEFPPAPSTFLTVIRWLLFVPGGILGGWLLGIAISFMLMLSDWLNEGHVVPITQLLIGAAYGWAPVFVGCLIAPSQRKVFPAIIMGLITASVGMLGVLASVYAGEELAVAQGAVWSIVAIVSTIYFSVTKSA